MANMATDIMNDTNGVLGSSFRDGDAAATNTPARTATLPIPNPVHIASNNKMDDHERALVTPPDEPTPTKLIPPTAIYVSSSVRSDSDDEVITNPFRRRRRATNNSFAVDLEDDDGESYIMPPSSKRFQFNMNIAKGVYVGLWAHSPDRLDSRKHAVYAYIDKTDKMRARVHPESKDGDMMYEGFPAGPGQSMVGPKDIIYESYLLPLSHSERKEFVRIRIDALKGGESPADRPFAEKQAVLDAVEAGKSRRDDDDDEVLQYSPSAPLAPQPKITPSSTPQKNRPSDVLLGYWKESLTPLEADRHAAYGKVQSDGKFRVRVARETRDGRPMKDFFPLGRSPWIDFDEVVLEPHLATVTRLEIKEYTWYLQQEDLKGLSNSQRKAAEQTALNSAKANVQAVAKAAGIDIQGLDADREAKRRQANESRKGGKARAAALPDAPSIESHRLSQPISKKTDLDTPITRSWSQPTSKKADLDSPVTRSSLKSENTKPDAIQPKVKARWTSKGDAREERLKKEREAAMERATALNRAQYSKADDAVSKEGRGGRTFKSGTPSSPEKLKSHSTSKGRVGNYPSNNGPPKLAEKTKEKYYDDLEYNLQMLANNGPPRSAEEARSDCGRNLEAQAGLARDGAPMIKIYGGVKYERKNTGPFAGKLVGSQRSVITIDGEDYVEYRILMRTQF